LAQSAKATFVLVLSALSKGKVAISIGQESWDGIKELVCRAHQECSSLGNSLHTSLTWMARSQRRHQHANCMDVTCIPAFQMEVCLRAASRKIPQMVLLLFLKVAVNQLLQHMKELRWQDHLNCKGLIA
jgi:hypothetical protein